MWRSTVYRYDDPTGQVEEAIESGPSGYRTTETTFAYERYAEMEGRNMLSQVAQETVYEQDRLPGARTPLASTVTKWVEFRKNGKKFWKPRATYRWKDADGDGAFPDFAPWGSRDAPPADPDEWVAASVSEEYTEHGQLTKVRDGRGFLTRLYYGGNARNQQNGAADLNGAYLTAVRRQTGEGHGGRDLEIEYDYDPRWGTVTEAKDANGKKTFYAYDGFGRLTSVRDHRGDSLLSHAYDYALDLSPSGAFDARYPNRVTTTAHTGTGDPLVTVTHLDGLGREVQTQQQSGAESIVTATAYDALGRVSKRWRPYATGGPASTYRRAYAFEAERYYDGHPGPASDERPFTETRYLDDPLGRPSALLPAGTAEEASAVAYAYGIEPVQLPWQSAAREHQYEEAADEEGHPVRTYTDRLGRAVLVRRAAEVDVTTTGGTTTTSDVPLADPVVSTYVDHAPAYGNGYWTEKHTTAFTVQPGQEDVRWSVELEATCDDPAGQGEEAFFRIHEGSASGPLVPGTSSGWAGPNEPFGGGFDGVAGQTYVAVTEVTLPVRPQGATWDCSGHSKDAKVWARVTETAPVRRETTVQAWSETASEYDALDRLVRSYPPNYFDPPHGEAEDFTTEYAYNTLGEVTAKATPDADGDGDGDAADERLADGEADGRYLYDRAGNLRYKQDAREAAEGKATFYRYDFAGRLTRLGQFLLGQDGAPATFAELEAFAYAEDPTSADPAPVPSFEADPGNGLTEQTYDQAPTATAFPWSAHAPTHPALSGTEGRLAAQATRLDLPGGTGEVLVLDGGDLVGSAETHTAATRIEAGPFTVLDGGDVTLRAGERVVLRPGFVARLGGRLKVEVDPALAPQGGVGGDPLWQVAYYGYDEEGRLSDEYVYAPGRPRLHLAYAYDRQGQITKRTATLGEDGDVERFYQWYRYDERGLLEAVYASAQDVQPSEPEVSYAYTAAGQVEEATYRSGTGTAGTTVLPYRYTVRGWLERIGEVDGASGDLFGAFYAYLGDGNVKESQYRNPASVEGTAAPERYRYRYAYDAMSRLKRADCQQTSGTGPSPLWQSYGCTVGGTASGDEIAYDDNGNLLSLERERFVGAAHALSYAYVAGTNRLDRVTNGSDNTQADYDYDPSGNVVAVTGGLDGRPAITSMTYDHRNLPVVVEQAGGATLLYRYDASGQRVYEKVEDASGSVAREAHHVRSSSGGVVAVLEGDGAVKHWNVLGGTTVGRWEAGGSGYSRRYYVTDHLGSVRQTLGEEGTPIGGTDYYPFGLEMPGRSMTQGAPTRENFTGHELDSETGLLYAGARYLDPAIGRWMSVDPRAEWYPGMSPYNYAGNNPITNYDPNGEFIGTILGAAIGCAVGAATGDGCKRGAISGAAAGAAADLVVFTAGTGAVALVAAGAVGGAVGSVVDQNLAGERVDWGEVGISAGAGGVLGGVAGKLAGPIGRGVGRVFGTRSSVHVSPPQVIGVVDDASTAVGRRGSPLTPLEEALNPGTTAAARNAPTMINGRSYSGHALDRMQERGLTPTVVENAIRSGNASPGNTPGTTVYRDAVNKVKVVVNDAANRVVTVMYGR